MQIAQSLTSADRLQQLLPDLFDPVSPTGEQFLRLQLTAELTVALDLNWVEESLQIDTRLVTPMPNMPPSVLGLMSSKGQVFWAVNLVELLELPVALPSTQYYEVVVVRALPAGAHPPLGHPPLSHPPIEQGWSTPDAENELFLGLVVPTIKGTIRLSPEDITSPSAAIATSLTPYLRGQVVSDTDTIIILSAAALGTVPSILSPT